MADHGAAADVAGGGRMLDVVRAGLLAAAMSDHDAAFEVLLEQAPELSPGVRAGLADRVAGCGHPDLGDRLRAGPTAVAA